MIRRLQPEDTEAVVLLERRIFGEPWTENMVSESICQAEEQTAALAHGAFGWFENGVLAGYLFSMAVAGEGELHRIAAAPEYRRHGIGKKLMEQFFSWLEEQSCTAAFLEVRAGNEAAIALYEACGFRETGKRRAYYHNPTEDARLFCCVREDWQKRNDRG